MKKTTYIHGLTMRYSCNTIDRTGVDAANAQDRAIITEHSDGIRLEAGYDERGLWHTPNPELIVQDTVSWQLSRNTFILSAIILIGLIWLVVHYAPQIDRWHL